MCLCCVPTLQLSFPTSRLARHLQKEAQSQHNNSEFTEDQKVSICAVKELDGDVCYGVFYCTDKNLMRPFLPQYTQTESEPSMAKTVAVIRCGRCSAV